MLMIYESTDSSSTPESKISFNKRFSMINLCQNEKTEYSRCVSSSVLWLKDKWKRWNKKKSFEIHIVFLNQ